MENIVLKREIEDKLIERKNKKDKKCLILRGPRQVGKTFIVRKFAKENYKYFIEINFVDNPKSKEIFEGSLSADAIMSNISLYLGEKAKFEPYKTLILLDEIQECPKARTALKFLTIDGTFDVIATGSLLGVNYSKVPSYPTGYVNYLDLQPLSFKEFLYANGVNQNIIEQIKNHFINQSKVSDFVNDRLMELFRQYIVVGGMPEVVKKFILTKNYSEVLSSQKQILEDYKNDIAKYAESTEKVKAKACLESIPSQLSKENKKFSYKLVEKNGRGRKYLGSLNWLIDAGIVNICYRINNLEFPLIAYQDLDNFKIYMADTGLLICMLDPGTNLKIIQGDLSIYKGAIFENIIAQILKCNERRLFYYTRGDTFELDFVLSSDGNIIPIEVKANNNKAKSLTTILKENPEMKGIKLVDGNVGVSNNLITLPLYMAMFL